MNKKTWPAMYMFLCSLMSSSVTQAEETKPTLTADLVQSILDFCTTLQQKRGFLPEHIDTIDEGGEMIVVVKKGNMMWKTPIAHEIAVGLEINNYSCAGL